MGRFEGNLKVYLDATRSQSFTIVLFLQNPKMTFGMYNFAVLQTCQRSVFEVHSRIAYLLLELGESNDSYNPY